MGCDGSVVGFVFGCSLVYALLSHSDCNVMFYLFLGMLLALGERIVSLGVYVNHIDSLVQIRALETIVDLREDSPDLLIMGWSSPEYILENDLQTLFIEQVT